MPICGTQLAEWFCERGILAATNRFRPTKPSAQRSIRRSTNPELLHAIATQIIAQCERPGNPANARSRWSIQDMAS
jgi:hypothetical protein